MLEKDFINPKKELSAKSLSMKLLNTKTNHVVNYSEVENTMYAVKKIIPEAFSFHTAKNGNRVIYLKAEYYDEFLSVAGFVKLKMKRARDMDSSDIAKLYTHGPKRRFCNLILAMKEDLAEAHDNRSELIEYKITNRFNGGTSICLDKSLLEEFVTKFGLESRQKKVKTKRQEKEICEKESATGLWKNADELRSYIDFPCHNMTSEAINALLEKFQSIIASAVKHSEDANEYEMNLRYLDTLCKYSGFPKNPVPRKNGDWKSVEELANKYILVEKQKLIDAMNDFYANMPNVIQVRKNYLTSQDELCLDTSHLQDFCKTANLPMVAGTKFAQKRNLNDKLAIREDYLNSTDLTDYFRNSIITIRSKLRESQDKMPLEAIRFLTFARPGIYLRKDYIQDF